MSRVNEAKREEFMNMDKEKLVDIIFSLQSGLDHSNAECDRLLETIKMMNQRKYGRKSEVNDGYGLIPLFADEAEYFNETEANKEEIVLSAATPRKSKAKGKKLSDLSRITERREEEISLGDDELISLFGESNYKRLPDQIISKLEYHRGYYEAVTYRVFVYAAKDESKASVPVFRAPAPAQLFEKSICTSSLLSDIVYEKYAKHVPLYRQEKALSESNIFIDRGSMARWIIKSYNDYLKYLVPLFKSRILASPVIHADETVVRCSEDCKGEKRQKDYIWVYEADQKSSKDKLVLFDYKPDRKMEHPSEFLKDYKGTLVCDGYEGYHHLSEEIIVAGCWVHLKRKHADYLKTLPKDKRNASLSKTAVDMISKIFHEDNKLDHLNEKDRYLKRQTIIRPLVEEFFAWSLKAYELTLPKSPTGEALYYGLNQKKYLMAFLDDPRVPMDNSEAERSIRPVTVGRKNWIMIDTRKGADASMMYYSIIETAKMNDLKVYDYILYLLDHLPAYCKDKINPDIPESLMPWSNELPAYLYNSHQSH